MLTLTQTPSLSLSLAHTYSQTHTHTHMHAHTHTLSLTHSLTRSKHKCWHSSTFMVWVNMCTVTSRKHVFDLVKIAIPFHDGKFGRYVKSGTVASSNQRFIQKEKAVLFFFGQALSERERERVAFSFTSLFLMHMSNI